MSVRHLLKSMALLWGLAVLLVTASVPAAAHEEHNKQKQAAELARQKGKANAPAAMQGGPTADHAQMSDMAEAKPDRSQMSNVERLLDWFGRLHPALVHFPIAFFPAALFTAVVGRRRPAFAAPVQFLVVAGGVFAPIAAVAGWIGGAGLDPDPVLAYHRWLGVAIGIVGAGLGFWAWKRPWEDRGAGMILALTVMTVAIAAQGFLGAAVTHGMEHLMF